MSLLHERYVVLVKTTNTFCYVIVFLVLSERYVFHAYVLCVTRVQICQFNNKKRTTLPHIQNVFPHWSNTPLLNTIGCCRLLRV